jgi:hypothetical protein
MRSFKATLLRNQLRCRRRGGFKTCDGHDRRLAGVNRWKCEPVLDRVSSCAACEFVPSRLLWVRSNSHFCGCGYAVENLYLNDAVEPSDPPKDLLRVDRRDGRSSYPDFRDWVTRLTDFCAGLPPILCEVHMFRRARAHYDTAPSATAARASGKHCISRLPCFFPNREQWPDRRSCTRATAKFYGRAWSRPFQKSAACRASISTK